MSKNYVKFSQVEQDKKSAFSQKKENSNIFENRFKPISYIKGDTMILAEIAEDSFHSKNGSITYLDIKNPLTGKEIKKSVSDNNVVVDKNSKLK